MNRTVKLFRRLFVTLIGFPLLIIGIILIPLPGPGLLVCLLALFILSLEFNWASKYFERAKLELKKIIDNAREKADKINKR